MSSDSESKKMNDVLDDPRHCFLKRDEQMALDILTRDLAYATQIEEDKQFAASLANEDNNLMPNNTKEVPFNDCLNDTPCLATIRDEQAALDCHSRDMAYAMQLQEDEKLAAALERKERNLLSDDLIIVDDSFTTKPDAQMATDLYTHDLAYATQEDEELARSLEHCNETRPHPRQQKRYNTRNRGQCNVNIQVQLNGGALSRTVHNVQQDIPNDYEALLDLTEQIGEAKHPGLAEDELNTLPTQIYSSPQGAAAAKVKAENPEDKQCRICFEDFASGDNLRALPCCHRYHKICLDTWIQTKAKCPICNLDVKEELKQLKQ